MDNQTNPTIALLAKNTEVNIRLTGKGPDELTVSAMIDPVEAELRRRVGPYIFGVDGEDLETVVGELLNQGGFSLAIAESCTGGLIASRITNIPGSSDYFNYGIVSYSNEAKVKLLQVSEASLQQFGAVSETVAKEMAQGVRKLANAHFGLAVTGIAGPGGGTPEKPVGLVYIALATENTIKCQEYRFVGDRETIKGLTANGALNMLRWYLAK